MPIPLCRHIKTTGAQCQSPALRNERFCYFHTTFNKRHRYFRPNQVTDPTFVHGRHVRLAPIEDRDSLQMALSQTVGALATGQIELKFGIAVLYGLQLVIQNMKQLEAHPTPAPDPETIVQTVETSHDDPDLAPRGPNPTIIEGQPAQLR